MVARTAALLSCGLVLGGVAPAGAVLVSSWGLDGDALDPVGGHDGTPFHGAFVAGYSGSGWKSADQAGAVWVPDDPGLTLSQFTIAGWFRLDGLGAANRGLVWKGNTSGSTLSTPFALSVLGGSNGGDAGRVRATITDGASSQSVVSIAQLIPGVFTHLAFSSDGSVLRLYVNGAEDAAIPHSIPLLLDSTFPLQFGGVLSGVVDNHFDGVVDEVRLYSTALTADEIRSLAAVAPEPATGLLLALGAAGLLLAARSRRAPVGPAGKDRSGVRGATTPARAGGTPSPGLTATGAVLPRLVRIGGRHR